MNNQKSIIGQNYRAKGVVAFDIETKTRAYLGKRSYKIIKDPYVSEYKSRIGFNPFTPPEAVYVNVLDERSGRTYQVVYEPANLLEHTNSDKPQTDQPGEPVDFVARAKQIAEELNALFTGGGIADKCAVAFFTVSDYGDDKMSKNINFIGGTMRKIKRSIVEACNKSPEAFEIVRGAAIEASIRDILDNQKK